MAFGFRKKRTRVEGKRRGELVTFQLNDELYARLDTVSKKYGVLKAQIIRYALIEKLNELEG